MAVLCISFFNDLTCQFTIHSNYISEIKLQQIDLPWPQTAADCSGTGSILRSEVSEAQDLLAPRFMRTHARELQKKKRENKRQRTWVAEGEGNIIVAEQSGLAGALRPKNRTTCSLWMLADYVNVAGHSPLQILQAVSIDCYRPKPGASRMWE